MARQTTDSGIPRFPKLNRSADPAERTAEYMKRSGKKAPLAKTLDNAMRIAMNAATREDLIRNTGPFYLVAQAIRKFGAKSQALTNNDALI